MPTALRLYPTIFSLCLAFCAPALGQEQAKIATGSVAGRVTASQTPAHGIEVQLLKPGRGRPERAAVAKTTTDKRGRYRFAGVEPGEYHVLPTAQTLLVLDRIDYNNQPGKRVIVTAGESAGGVDFDLLPPSRISGRVTDADGEPVAGMAVRLQSDSSHHVTPADRKPVVTDAQGGYRAAGIPPGRYFVSVGDSGFLSSSRGDNSHRRYAETFHPDAADQGKAVEVEVPAGGEATGIDIRVGPPLKTYNITGRMVDGETERPVPGVELSVEWYGTDGRMRGRASGSWRTDAEGRFTVFDVLPGRYLIAPQGDAASNTYAESVGVEVKDGDVAGLEIRARRAGTISGTVELEGERDPAAASKLAGLRLLAAVIADGRLLSESTLSAIKPDGSFRIGGLKPGKVMLHLVANRDAQQGVFTLLRVEREGADLLRGGLVLGSGEDVTGLRVIVGTGTGRVRGQVIIEGGPLDGLLLGVYYRREGAAPGTYNSATPDARGRFVIQNLAEGEYEFTVGPMSVMHTSAAGSKTVSRMPTVKQSVVVKAGAEAEVTLVVALRP